MVLFLSLGILLGMARVLGELASAIAPTRGIERTVR
jgi:hypothetical protein